MFNDSIWLLRSFGQRGWLVKFNPPTKDLEKVKYLLRYNNWQHDPLSAAGYQGPSEPRAPENAIAARYDLHPWPKVHELPKLLGWFPPLIFLRSLNKLTCSFFFNHWNGTMPTNSAKCHRIPVNHHTTSFPLFLALPLKVRSAFGNTDAKICKASDCLALRFSAISGPTADDQPPFAWEGEWESFAHIGHPLLWNFSWVDFAAKSVELATVMIWSFL